MFASLLLVSANIAAASPTVPTPWFIFDDYPMDAIRMKTEGMSEFELVVAPTGQPVACAVTRSSGNNILDRQACNVSMRRAKFAPARNARAAAGLWHLPQPGPVAARPRRLAAGRAGADARDHSQPACRRA